MEVIAFPLRIFAALFWAAAPAICLPGLHAFAIIAETLDPNFLAIASVLPTISEFKPAFDSWLAATDTINVIPPNFSPSIVARFKAIDKLSPDQSDNAKVIIAVTPKVVCATTTPFFASYLSDSMFPAFAMFTACLYV